MPFDAAGKWIPEDDSAANKLTGMLATDSKYVTQARAAGERAAGRRGLLNSSIAAGSGEAAAIAAAAPIASQDAAAIAARNTSKMEGDINLTNSTAIQTQQDKSALDRLNVQQTGQEKLQTMTDTAASERLNTQNTADLLRQREAAGYQLTLQDKSDLAAADRQKEQLSSAERQALLAADAQARTQSIASANDLSGQYLQALSNLTANEKVPAATRNAMISEFQRVTMQSQVYSRSLEGISLKW